MSEIRSGGSDAFWTPLDTWSFNATSDTFSFADSHDAVKILITGDGASFDSVGMRVNGETSTYNYTTAGGSRTSGDSEWPISYEGLMQGGIIRLSGSEGDKLAFSSTIAGGNTNRAVSGNNGSLDIFPLSSVEIYNIDSGTLDFEAEVLVR